MPDADTLAGTLIGDRYRILRPLPSPFGIPRYAAQDSRGQRLVLLAADRPHVRHLTQVGDILRSLRHPALPPVLETVESGQATYLVLDMPQDNPIADQWQDPSVSERQRLTWLLQLCDLLEALQSMGAVAVALPPEAVAVAEGRVLLADPSGIQMPPIHPEYLPGIFHYTPPEIFADPWQVSDQASVYVLGALLASLLLGRQLRQDDIRDDRIRPIREVLPTLSPEVEDLLLAAMHLDPARRPYSISLLAELLGGLQPLLDPRLVSGAATNVGLLRLANQDRYLIREQV